MCAHTIIYTSYINVYTYIHTHTFIHTSNTMASCLSHHKRIWSVVRSYQQHRGSLACRNNQYVNNWSRPNNVVSKKGLSPLLNSYRHTYIHTYIHSLENIQTHLHYWVCSEYAKFQSGFHLSWDHRHTLHTYIHTYIHTFIHTCIRTYIHNN